MWNNFARTRTTIICLKFLTSYDVNHNWYAHYKSDHNLDESLEAVEFQQHIKAVSRNFDFIKNEMLVF